MANIRRLIPNLLTSIRLFLIPVFIVLLIDPTPAARFFSACIFIGAAITDFLDGFFARKFNAQTDFGKLFDPLADKILVMTALVMLVGIRDDRYGESYVPAWMVVFVLAREMWVTGVRGLAATRGIILPAGQSGKVKSALQMLAIVLLLLHENSWTLLGLRVNAQFVGLNLLMLSILVSVMGLYDYTAAMLKGEGVPK